jgi:ubiquinol-cytochrome c reductase iron-sulfur subunit
MAGRVFTGSPAPTNLVIPPHKIDGMKLVIGIGQDGKEA